MNETEQKTNQTPYSAWLQTEILRTLQETVSDHPGEYAFLINVQGQELYWALIVKEMQAAQIVGHRSENVNDAYWKGQLVRRQVHSNMGQSVTARCWDFEELLGAAMKTL